MTEPARIGFTSTLWTARQRRPPEETEETEMGWLLKLLTGWYLGFAACGSQPWRY